MILRLRSAAGAALIVVTVVALVRGAGGQLPKIDTEQVLSQRFGFSSADVSQVRAGRAVTKIVPSGDAAEVAAAGAVRISGSQDRLVYWIKQIASFRKALEFGVSGRLSEPPRIEDFAELSLSDQDVQDLAACRPGACEIKLGDKAIARFQSEVNWSAPDARRRADLLVRQMMLELAQAYLQGGNGALGVAHNEKAPRAAAEEFRALLSRSKNLYELSPPLAAFLERFPAASLPGAEHFLYWGNGGAGPDHAISLHHLVIAPSEGDGTIIADKQLYSTRYIDAGACTISLTPVGDGTGYYALVGARARSRELEGTAARLLRRRVESSVRDTANMYLTWLQGSMAQAR